MQASRTVIARPAWQTRIVSPSPMDSTVARVPCPADPSGQAAATSAASAVTPRRTIRAIAGATGNDSMQLLPDWGQFR